MLEFNYYEYIYSYFFNFTASFTANLKRNNLISGKEYSTF